MIKHLRFAQRMKIVAIGALAGVLVSSSAFAQADADDIEGLFNKDEQQSPDSRSDQGSPSADSAAAESRDAGSNSSSGGNTKTSPPSAAKSAVIKDVADLGKLSEFNDIAVIQRRYLPKTGRFEAYIAPSLVLNDAFFINYGLSGRLGYSFSERYGVEFLGTALSTTERSITTDLRQKRGVVTTSLLTPKSYIGADFRWTPVYGKMTWLNAKIVPFDLYFSIGPGLTATNLGTSEPTLHVGTGQIFAHTKGMAFRWDFGWNMFFSAAGDPSGTRSIYNTLYLSAGVSFFFPEATYR